MSAATRSMPTSRRRWSWRSATRPTSYSLATGAIDRMPRFQVIASSAREALLNQQIACRNQLRIRCGSAGDHELALAILEIGPSQSIYPIVVAGLGPAIHEWRHAPCQLPWMPGTRFVLGPRSADPWAGPDDKAET